MVTTVVNGRVAADPLTFGHVARVWRRHATSWSLSRAGPEDPYWRAGEVRPAEGTNGGSVQCVIAHSLPGEFGVAPRQQSAFAICVPRVARCLSRRRSSWAFEDGVVEQLSICRGISEFAIGGREGIVEEGIETFFRQCLKSIERKTTCSDGHLWNDHMPVFRFQLRLADCSMQGRLLKATVFNSVLVLLKRSPVEYRNLPEAMHESLDAGICRVEPKVFARIRSINGKAVVEHLSMAHIADERRADDDAPVVDEPRTSRLKQLVDGLLVKLGLVSLDP
ncbi:hypothetical protein R1sor_014654 [Riccia sorocarpa]|uniref:Uncharacterized protein n=1 Tax=Riccia sorocarpa TaxID=122646 RepID=A0ABD3HD69_9MARC